MNTDADLGHNSENAPQSLDQDFQSRLKQELTWQNGKEIVVDAAGMIPGLGAVCEIVFGVGDHDPEELLKKRQFKWVLEELSRISRKIDQLLIDLPDEEHPEPADVAAIIEAAMMTSRKTAGSKKRKLLKNAIVNAFDTAKYKEGLSLRFLKVLEELEYGDVRLLSQLLERKSVQLGDLSQDPRALIYHHLETLNKLGLVQIWNHNSNYPLGMNRGQGPQAQVTLYGEKFLGFVSETIE